MFQDIIMAEAPYPLLRCLGHYDVLPAGLSCHAHAVGVSPRVSALLALPLTTTSRVPQDFGSFEDAEAGSWLGRIHRCCFLDWPNVILVGL